MLESCRVPVSEKDPVVAITSIMSSSDAVMAGTAGARPAGLPAEAASEDWEEAEDDSEGMPAAFEGSNGFDASIEVSQVGRKASCSCLQAT